MTEKVYIRVVNPGGCCHGKLGYIAARWEDGSGRVQVATDHLCPTLYKLGLGRPGEPYATPVDEEEIAWRTLAELDQEAWARYMEADITFLEGYASCDRFAEAALILRRAEGDGLAEKLAADDAEDDFVPPVSLACIADTCPRDGEMVDFRLCAYGFRGTMLHLGAASGEDDPFGDSHPNHCPHYLGQSESGQVWCDHPDAVSAPDRERHKTYMECLRAVWGR